jgi:hypothetical protein
MEKFIAGVVVGMWLLSGLLFAFDHTERVNCENAIQLAEMSGGQMSVRWENKRCEVLVPSSQGDIWLDMDEYFSKLDK